MSTTLQSKAMRDTLLPEPADPQSQQVANDSFAPARLIRQSGRNARHSDMPEDKPRWNPTPRARLTKQEITRGMRGRKARGEEAGNQRGRRYFGSLWRIHC